nr:MAG TPA: hypothetical protein [Caudoviricetes sp.]
MQSRHAWWLHHKIPWFLQGNCCLFWIVSNIGVLITMYSSPSAVHKLEKEEHLRRR